MKKNSCWKYPKINIPQQLHWTQIFIIHELLFILGLEFKNIAVAKKTCMCQVACYKSFAVKFLAGNPPLPWLQSFNIFFWVFSPESS